MSRHRIALSLLLAFAFISATFTTAVAAPGSGASADPAATNVSYTAEPEECAFLSIINNYRKKNGLGTLTISVTLAAAAEHHSADMAKYNYFSHTLYNGTTWSQNIANYGYPSDTARAENIAAGRATAAEVFEQWKNSSGHNANMLNPKFNAIGIGRAMREGSRYTWYWTTTFGSRVDKAYSCSGSTSTGGGEKPGTLLKIAGGGRTSSSTPSTTAYDGKTSTAWYTTATKPPSAAYVYFDLGTTKSISKIQWYFSKSGSADAYKIQVSTDKKTWTTVTNQKNGKAGTWYTKNISKKARYVRVYFTNPNRDKVLGYLAEIKIYA